MSGYLDVFYTTEMCKTIGEKKPSFSELIYVICAKSIKVKPCFSVKLRFSSKQLAPFDLKSPVTEVNHGRAAVVGMEGPGS